MPTDKINISAAFPVAIPATPDGEITPAVVPAGRAASLTLTGPYEGLAEAYETLLTWMSGQGLTPGEFAFEQYLTMRDGEGDPAENITKICWLIA